MRSFELARKVEDKKVVTEINEDGKEVEVLAYPSAQLPEYQTKYAAGADFFAAETVVIPSIWKSVFSSFVSKTGEKMDNLVQSAMKHFGYTKEENNKKKVDIVPTMVHTGIKACMEDDEVLELYNRSSNPGKRGLILANSVGVIDKDFYNNESDDGEIRFAFYNFKLWDVTINEGDRIGQGVFKKVLRPVEGLRVKDVERTGGIGSTNK